MDTGRLLIIGGICLIALGIAFTLGLGRLPGDISFKSGNFTFYFPIVTSIIVSIVLTLIFNFILRR